MKLAPLTLEKCEIVRRWRNDCIETLRTPYALTQEQQADFYRNVVCNPQSNHRYWAILWSNGDPAPDIEGFREVPILLGMGGITHITYENRIGEISLIIDPALRQKGYGEKAVELLLDAAFNRMGLNCVYGECYTLNTDGIVFWTKIADKYNSNKSNRTILRDRKFWDGKFWASMYFDILKDEYDRAKSSTTDGTLQSTGH